MWPFKQKKKRPKARRAFEAAAANRLLADWLRTSKSIDEDINSGLEALRGRSRGLCQNNDYARKFMSMLATNVVGPEGIGFQSRVMSGNGSGGSVQDRVANDMIEAAWRMWRRSENASASGKYNFDDLCRLAIQTVARDGELFVYELKGYTGNTFRYALHFIEADYLDVNLNKSLSDGRRVRMGVEMDRWRRPLRYHFKRHHPTDRRGTERQDWQVLDAADIIHLYLPDSYDQTRGYPWMTPAMKRLHMVGAYEETELVASRVGAGKMGFFYSDDDYPNADDQEESGGALISEVSPGTFEQLPSGTRVETFDPDHPNAQFENFIKSVLRGVASGLNVSYNTLSSNLEGVNYSSIRQGVLDERDTWKGLQNWLIQHFCTPVFESWLMQALVTKQVALPARKFDKWNSPDWQPRRWSWVDPLKDMKAHETSIALGLNSRTEVKREVGGDLRETFQKLSDEARLAQELNISIDPGKDLNDGDQDDQDAQAV